MMCLLRLASCVVLSLCIGSAALAGTFVETEFDPEDFTSTMVANNGGKVVLGQDLEIGNPGGCPVETYITTEVGTTNFRYVALHKGWTVDPKTTPIDSFSFDIAYTPTQLVITPRPERGIVLSQGGRFFVASANAKMNDPFDFVTFSADYAIQNDFCLLDLDSGKIDRGVHPNFGPTGAVIGIGFESDFNHNMVPQRSLGGAKLDNLRITVHPLPSRGSALASR